MVRGKPVTITEDDIKHYNTIKELLDRLAVICGISKDNKIMIPEFAPAEDKFSSPTFHPYRIIDIEFEVYKYKKGYKK